MKKLAKILSLVMLVVMASLVMTACVPANADKAKAKMEDAGYQVMVTEVAGIETLRAEKDGDMLVAVWAESSADAKDAEEGLEGTLSMLETQLGLELEMGRSGKCVYYGTAKAIKDFK